MTQEDITCNITGHIFKEPVKLPSGQYIEKSALILAAIERGGVFYNPYTEQPLSFDEGTTIDTDFQKEINDYLEKNSDLKKEQYVINPVVFSNKIGQKLYILKQSKDIPKPEDFIHFITFLKKQNLLTNDGIYKHRPSMWGDLITISLLDFLSDYIKGSGNKEIFKTILDILGKESLLFFVLGKSQHLEFINDLMGDNTWLESTLREMPLEKQQEALWIVIKNSQETLTLQLLTLFSQENSLAKIFTNNAILYDLFTNFIGEHYGNRAENFLPFLLPFKTPAEILKQALLIKYRTHIAAEASFKFLHSQDKAFEGISGLTVDEQAQLLRHVIYTIEEIPSFLDVLMQMDVKVVSNIFEKLPEHSKESLELEAPEKYNDFLKKFLKTKIEEAPKQSEKVEKPKKIIFIPEIFKKALKPIIEKKKEASTKVPPPPSSSTKKK